MSKELDDLYKEMGWEKQELNLGNKKIPLMMMKVDEKKKEDFEMLDHNFMCLWCGKDFNSYTQMVQNEIESGLGYSWMMYCSDRCARLDMKYGKMKEGLMNIPRYLWWKPKYAVLDWFWSEYCPECFKTENRLVKLDTILSGDIYACHECWNQYEFHRERKSKHPTLRQFLKKCDRLIVYIREGGKTKVIGSGASGI